VGAEAVTAGAKPKAATNAREKSAEKTNGGRADAGRTKSTQALKLLYSEVP